MDPTLAKIEELEKKRAERLAALDAKEREQYATDLEAREQVEADHGPTAAVTVAKFVPGLPTCAFVRCPSGPEYKRYVDQVGRGVEKSSGKAAATRQAQDLLAQSCWVYPLTPEGRAAMLDKFPGILTPIALAATALAEGKAEDEGKG